MSSRRPDGTLRRSNRRSQCQPIVPAKKVEDRRRRRMQTVPGSCIFKSLALFRSSSISKMPSVRQDYRSHFQEIQRSIKLIRASGPSDDSQLLSKLQNIPRRVEDRHKKTLILDLDETLVHCSQPNDEDAVHVLDDIYVQIRPFAQECLVQASQTFEVFVFTASLPAYADPIIDLLDPTGNAVRYRLYRDQCISHPQGFVKDLRIFNRNLEDILIVDNSVWSFARQIDNGVPILPWTGDPLDEELRSLLSYLKEVNAADDVRDVNRKAFKLHEL